MSDFNIVEQKTVQGVEWRGSITVNIDGQEAELSVRQLRDPEFREVMGKIDRDELAQLRDSVPDGMWEEYRELQNKEERTEEETARMQEIADELEGDGQSLFDVLSDDTFDGLALAAKYGVEPDDEDLIRKFSDPEYVARVEKEYGINAKQPADIYDAVKDDIVWVIDNSTDFLSFTIGMQVLLETVGDSKNSENTLHQTTGLNS